MHGKRISAGNLRHIVKIQQVVETQSSSGAVESVWQDLYTRVYASIDPVSVREFLAAASTESQVTARITIRYKKNIVAKMRIVHGSTVYQIEGVQADIDSGIEYLTLACSTGVMNDEQSDV